MVEIEKKPELKKPIVKGASSTSKLVLKSAMKPFAPSSSVASNAPTPSVVKPTETKPLKPASGATASNSKGKGKAAAKTPLPDDDISQPSQIVQTQMAARAKAQLQAARQAGETLVASESIELPDINSEYSDSEDEDRPRTFDPPVWAQSPDLRHALQVQSTINPDDIFGAVRPLRMEEVFRTRVSRFRPRTSSANWTGTDMLTVEEQDEYVRRMGYR